VSLVGAGPGDPSLLTLKALKRLREADVVYHDALVSAEILALRREGARLVSVGKRRGAFRLTQEEIEEALVRDARAGLAVVRLKGGDPFVFGRGSEEALVLAERGVPFEIVPGISSGIAVPALSGIPLTHRGLSSSAAFVTAHDLAPGPAGDEIRRRLRRLARGAETLVIFMAGAEAARVGRTLLDAGLPPGTPAALIESGTLPGERFTRTTLRGLARADGSRSEGPVLIVVGRTVALSEALRQPIPARRPERRAG
jgi:uroporphyrin-III C-methyltransferase